MLIVLDRDGVINEDSKEYIKNPEEWIAIENSLEAITRLNKAGHTVVVATNQSGVGRGYYSLETLDKIHQKMRDALAAMGGHIDALYFCSHTPANNCDCRKPKPGMLQNILRDYPVKLEDAILIGDSLRDIQAAHAIGLKGVLVKTGNGQSVIDQAAGLSGVPIYNDLSAVVDAILKNGRI